MQQLLFGIVQLSKVVRQASQLMFISLFWEAIAGLLQECLKRNDLFLYYYVLCGPSAIVLDKPDILNLGDYMQYQHKLQLITHLNAYHPADTSYTSP
jgi:hypothetical protein